MISKTYVNEVDVRKVKPGQPVEIGLDAYPDKKLTGVVTKVANVGEQRPNSDAKVFQVDVVISRSDPSLRPAMTTSNKIVTSLVEDALFVPLECLHSQFDSITYVFTRQGLNTFKQEVMIGLTNANDAVLLAGVSEGDRVFLSVPSGLEDSQVDLLPEMNGKRQRPEEEEVPELEGPRLLNGPGSPSPDGQPRRVRSQNEPQADGRSQRRDSTKTSQ
jgi:hypothetical protein